MKIAVQMDAIESIKVNSDTTFALMLEAFKRGYELYYYQTHNVSMLGGEVLCSMQKITHLQKTQGEHFELEPVFSTNLSDMNVILMRQDPPFDMNYLTYTYMLDKIKHKTLVINDPTEVRNCPEKIFVCDFAEFMPPTLITSEVAQIKSFLDEHKDIVIKPLNAFGGQDVFRVAIEDFEQKSLELLAKYKEPIIAQKFLKNVVKGDKRIILIDGIAKGAVNRMPEEGSIRANFAQGGTGGKTTLTKREQQICKALEPELKRRKLFLVGIDVIDGYLTEINVTSPTGIQSINQLDGVCLEADFWDAVEATY